MALVQCPDCGKDVSDQAPACIHCGRPRPGQGAPPGGADDEAGPSHDAGAGRFGPGAALTLLGALALAGGLGLLFYGRSDYAAPLLVGGLAAAALGEALRWLARR